MSKKLIAVLLVIAMTLTFVTPAAAIDGFPGDSKPLALLKGQSPVYKDMVATELLDTVYNGNSANISGWQKISGNKESVNIPVNGDVVGRFVFDKKGNAPNPYTDFLKIEIYDNLPKGGEVYIRWHCSKYYAYADLSAPGVYYIPQLMQDNGKMQSFDQIWLGTGYTAPSPAQITIAKNWIGYEGYATDGPEEEATFIFNGGNNVVHGTYEVMAGTYVIIENEIDDYDLISVEGADSFDLDARSATIEVAAGGDYTVIFTNQDTVDPNPKGEFTLKKMVIDDELKFEISAWLTNNTGDPFEILDDITFELYHSDENGIRGEWAAEGTVGLDSTITFSPRVDDGWYLVHEVMGDLAKEIFDEADDLLIYFGETSSSTATNALYLITGYGGNLGVSLEEYWIGDDYDDLKDSWNGNLANKDEYYDLMADIAAKYDIELAWSWKEAQVGYAAPDYDFHGKTWSETYEFYLGNTIITDEDDEVKIYFGADDAAVIRINGEVAAYSIAQLIDNGDGTFEFNYPLSAYQGPLGGFRIYCADILDYLRPGEINTITIDTMNQDIPANNPKSDANPGGNPTGMLLVFEVAYGDATFDNTLKVVDAGEFTLKKTVVDGELKFDINAWLTNNTEDPFEILDDITFELYYSDETGTMGEFAAIGMLGYDNKITFSPKVGTGWYLAVERLGLKAAEVFEEAENLLFYFNAETNVVTGNSSGFDYDSLYKILYNLSDRRILGLAGLNGGGEVFPISVYNSETGDIYPSYCAHAGSQRFAGDNDLGCVGYMVAGKYMAGETDAVPYEDFISAYNYIEDKYGSLNNNRVMVQVITWALLGAIDTASDEFANANLTPEEYGNILDVIANLKGYAGNGKIVDLVYMTCENPQHDFQYCQPQLVPVYGGEVSFDNLPKITEKGDGTLIVTAEVNLTYDIVTYEPLYNTKALSNGTWVSKSIPAFTFNNGMTYVPIDVYSASLEEGIWIEIADSSPSNRGSGLFYNVKIENGLLTVSFDDNVFAVPNNSIGIVLSDVPFASRPTSELKHDNALTKPLPFETGDVVYLYFHSQGGIEWYSEEILDWIELERETIDGEYEGSLTLTITGPNEYFYEDNNFDSYFALFSAEQGDYEITLSGEGFEPVVKFITVAEKDIAEAIIIIDIKDLDIEIKETFLNLR